MLYLLSNRGVQATLTAELYLVLLFISVPVLTITVITVLCYTEVVVVSGFSVVFEFGCDRRRSA